MLFENPVPIPGTGMAEIPVIGGLFIPDLEPDHSDLLPMIVAALVAREKFHRDAPGCPILPLRAEDCEEMENADDHRLNLVGCYGGSMRYALWDPAHPRFGAFCSGLMANKHTPAELRNDRELRREFRPHRLKGLCGGHLHWRSPAMIAFDRKMAARNAAYEAWQAAQSREFTTS
jgi:hypothetical protein